MTHPDTPSPPDAVARKLDDLEQTLSRLDDGFYRVDLEGVIQKHNPAFGRILGFDPGRDLTGAKTPDFWRDQADRQPYLDRLMTAGAIHNLEVAARRVDGTPITVLLSAHLVRDADGAPLAIEGTVRDVSDHKAAELALRERVKELHCLQDIGKAVEAAGDDLGGLFDRIVRILARSWLHTDVTVARIRVDGQVHQTGDLDACAAVQAADLLVDGQVRGAVEVGYTQARPQQDEGPFLEEERKLIDAVAERLGHVIERLEYEQVADRERDTLRAVFDGIEDVIYVADPETYELLHVNETFKKTWGADVLGKKCHRVIQGRDAPCEFCTNDLILGDKLGQTHVWEIQNEVSGAWFRCLDKAIRWTDGRMVRFELASDITDQKNAAESLRASEERFRRIAESSPDMIYCMSLPDGIYEYVSPASERVFGHPPEVFYQTPLIIREAIHPDFHEYFAAEWDKLLADQAPPIYEYKIVRPDGRTGWLNQRNVIMRAEDGTPNAIWGIVTDVTEVVEAKQAIERHKAHLEDEVAQRTAELRRKTELTDAINRIFREALACETEEQVAQAALKVAEELTGSKFGFIGVVNAEGKFDTIGLSNPGWEACDVQGSNAALLLRGMELRGIWATVIKSGRTLIVNDPTAHPDRVGVPPGHPPLTSFLGAPFKQADRAIGMIALGNKPGGYGPQDQEATEALSGAFHEVLIRKGMELQLQRQARIQSGLAELSDRMLGDQPVEPLCRNVITFLCGWLEVPTGLLYLAGEDGVLRLSGSYAHKPKEDPPRAYRPGEGLVGQAALEKKTVVIDDLPEDYFSIESGLGEIRPRSLLIAPIELNDRVLGVVELGALKALGEDERQFLESASENIGYAIESALARDRQAGLLEESQQMTEELQSQQEELRTTNEELEEQTQRLAASEAGLKAQQEELQVTNEELEEKTELLGRQKQAVEQARREISAKADELALASKYKSEFLANMSHELRTPLNSLLLLARSLMDNKTENLNPDQVESAEVIHASGNALLSLINEVLDLSKIEAGRMDLHLDGVHVEDMASAARSDFGHVAKERGLSLEVSVAQDTPERITSDRKRVEQVIRNLVSNAIKFTQQGSVTVGFAPAQVDGDGRARALAIAVSDTGIGIDEEQQQLIFEAFKQVDGSTARRYEGTGLGLSISKELAHLLGGEIHLQSRPGQGSTFTVVLPVDGPDSVRLAAPAEPPVRSTPAEPRPPQTAPAAAVRAIPDDRDGIADGERSILLIEDDAHFAQALAGQCREQGLKVLAAATGENGVELARRYGPQGIVLDLKLPGMDGWQVLEQLKDAPATRHIPVHIMSADEPSPRALHRGAIGYVQKPLSPEQIQTALARIEQAADQGIRRVLVVEDEPVTRAAMVALLADDTVEVDEADSGAQALAALAEGRYDCMVLDLGLTDMTGGALLERIEKSPDIEAPPVIVHTARDLTWEEDLELRAYSDSIIVKGVRSNERLLDEVSLFLHRVVAEMPEQKRQVITSLHEENALIQGKTALLVDDDMRTLFALSKILADQGMQIVKAENGQKALDVLEQTPGVDVVLMDIMMPVMDGYEAMRRIRAQERFAKLPIIALTAKAMQGDQERCIQAGASDYLPKPVDRDRLLSMLRVWLYR